MIRDGDATRIVPLANSGLMVHDDICPWFFTDGKES